MHPLLLASLVDCIQCLQRADESLYWSANTHICPCIRIYKKNVTYEFILIYPVMMLSMSCSSHLDDL